MSENLFDIENKAYELLSETGYEKQFPVQPHKIAEHLGFETKIFQCTDEIKNISGTVDHIRKVIYINKEEPLPRQIFTIAHEIGHIVFDGANKSFVDYRKTDHYKKLSTEEKSKEQRANHFAACLLMPRFEFIPQYKKSGGDLKEIAAYFFVTEHAAFYRSVNLGLIDGQGNRFN